jgi:hypothetical protein
MNFNNVDEYSALESIFLRGDQFQGTKEERRGSLH